MTGGYSAIAVADKLGMRSGTRVLLVGAPTSVDLAVSTEVDLRRRAGSGSFDVIVLFCPRTATLLARFGPLIASLSSAGAALWACWPKKSSGVRTDLTESVVREHGLQCGLVDVKIAAIDATWSGLKFVRRRADRIR